LNELAAARDQNGLHVLKWWAGPKLLVMLSFPSNFTEQQALTVIGTLQELPAVEKVVAVSAFNLHFRSGDFVRAYGPNDTIPDVARRGFDADRIGRPPPWVRDQASLNLTPHIPNRLIVGWKEEYIWRADTTGFAQVMEDFHRDAGCHVVREIRYSPTKLVQILEFDDPSTLADKLRRYIESGLVVYAQPDFVYKTMAAPDDPWYLSSPGPQWSLPIISAEQAWGITTGDPSVIIAVADSGANVIHPDFITNLWSGQNNGENHNFISNPNSTNVDDDLVCPGCPRYHGSAVASIIGAQGNNLLDMAGVAWDTSLMILKVVDSTDHSTTLAVADAINYAADHGATAINLSVGFYDAVCIPDGQGGYTCSAGDYDETLFGALQYARKLNMVVVCAAGNGGISQLQDRSFPIDNDVNLNRISPASIPTDNNISVLATRRDNSRASYSSYGKYRVDLAAPGGVLLDQIPGLKQTFSNPPSPNDLNNIYGTSAAAPHVAGALALIKSLYLWEDYHGIRDRVLMGTDPIPGTTPGVDGKCRTNGRLNLYKALQPRSLLLNLSTRARVEGGDRIMIGGFTIKGSGSLTVVIRGLGPSLSIPGVPSLTDPKIQLDNSNGKIASNDDWGHLSQQDQTYLASVMLTPSDSHEAALVQTLSAGAYTVSVESQDGNFGIGLFEIYALGDEQTRLVNLSTRCLVGTGDEVVIAGTLIGNSTDSLLPKPDRRLLMFGKGPSLGQFGVTGFLVDPQIQVNTTGEHNNNWTTIDDDSGDGNALEEKLNEALLSPTCRSQTALPDPCLKESALWPTFSPGAYTVTLSGVNQSTGIGLIEFYEY
jgi:hypothetical protein